MKAKRIIAAILAVLIALGSSIVPVDAEETLVFNPTPDAGNYVTFDMYVGLRNSAADSQAIMNFINRARKEACDEGLWSVRDHRHLTPADYTPITWSGEMERYALTRAADICFNFSHGGRSVVGVVDGGSSRYVGFENIAWASSGASIEKLMGLYYSERSTYIARYNEGVEKGLEGATLSNYIFSSALGHYTDMIDRNIRAVGGATVERGASRNVLVYSRTPGDNTFLDKSGGVLFRIPVTASAFGGVFTYTPPAELEYGKEAKGGFTLAGGPKSDSFVSATGVTIEAKNPEIATIADDLRTFTAHKSGTANFIVKSGDAEIGSFKVNVTVPITSITLGKQPTSTDYTLKGGYDLSGATLRLKYADDSVEEVPVTQNMVSNEARNGRKYDVTLKYEEKEVKISLNDKTPDHVVEMSIKPPNKVAYSTDEELDLSEGRATLTYYFGDTKTVALTDASVKISGFNNQIEGQQELKVSVGDVSSSFTVSVTKPTVLVGIEVTPPKKNYYCEGDELMLNGGKVTMVYSNGMRMTMALDQSMISGYDKDKIGTQEVTVETNGKTGSFFVNVYGKAQYAEIIKNIDVEADEEIELADVDVPMNASDPWLVTQAIKLYNLRPKQDGLVSAKRWPFSFHNLLMFIQDFCSIEIKGLR